MANRLAFHYFPGKSFLHQWDARCKLFGLLALAVCMLRMEVIGLAVFTALLALAFAITGLPWRSLFSDLKTWGLFLVLIFLVQALLTPQQSAPHAVDSSFAAGSFNIGPAAVTCWRLALVLCYALLFTMVTRPRDLQNALIWLMKPLPFIPGRRIAIMATITLRFVPLILDQAEEVRQAIKCRAGNRRKNPVQLIKILVLPLFRRSLTRADELALALAARGYREDLPVHLPGIPTTHVLCLLLWLCLVLAGSTAPLPSLLASNVGFRAMSNYYG